MPEPADNQARPGGTGVCRVVILGSTGSIGTQTVEAIEHLNRLHDAGRFPRRFEVIGLSAGSKQDAVLAQADRLGVKRVALHHADTDDARVIPGPDASTRLVRELADRCDLVVGAIVGSAGLPSVVSALELGIDVALANKETLVAAGSVVIPLARRTGAQLRPIDSEHAGVWQCLAQALGTGYAPPTPASDAIARIVLTASGGAFRGRDPGDVRDATADQALAHPVWDMGAKVTVDTATLVNKSFELIEAHWLFGIEPDRLDAIIHPTSTAHAFVAMRDGTVVSQLGTPDMRTPILRALAFPHACPEPIAPLDPGALGMLEFRPIEGAWRRAIEIGMRAMRAGGDAGAVFNAANEVAVHAFLRGDIRFGRILDTVEAVFDAHETRSADSIDAVLEADRRAREHAESLLRAGVS